MRQDRPAKIVAKRRAARFNACIPPGKADKPGACVEDGTRDRRQENGMMKEWIAGAFALAMTTGAQAADDVTLQLKWVTQAQFAGYFVAQAKGFYEEENLNVTIKPGGPDIAPTQVVAGGGAALPGIAGPATRPEVVSRLTAHHIRNSGSPGAIGMSECSDHGTPARSRSPRLRATSGWKTRCMERNCRWHRSCKRPAYP
jgi:hypothetical protein